MKINPKSEKGAITLVVLVGMLFLTAFLMSMYISIANKAQNSAETTKQISEKYNNIDEAEAIYDSYFANTDVIPIYTKEQLTKVGSGDQVLINGKVYTFLADAYYTIQNDLDLGGIYDENTHGWSGEQWTPIANGFKGILDGLGHTITGLYINNSQDNQGLFGTLKGTVKNLSIEDSYIKANSYVGSIAGKNEGTIVNCYNTASIIGNTNVTGGYFKSITTGEQIDVWNDNVLEENAYFVSGTYIATAPEGFKVSKNVLEQTIADGMVIKDSNENEFVWVPCTTNINDERGLTLYAKDTRYNDGTIASLEYNYKNYNDWTDNGGDVESVGKYDGFYVARYEAGVPANANFYVNTGDTTYYTATTTPSKNVDVYIPVSKPKNQAWNCITQINAIKVSEKMYEDSTVLESKLIDTYAWDTIVNWMESRHKGISKNSTNYGNYMDSKMILTDVLYAIHVYDFSAYKWGYATTYQKGSLEIKNRIQSGTKEIYELATGCTENTKVLNIYDMAGNLYEMTTEVGYRNNQTSGIEYGVLRGGDLRDTGTAMPITHRSCGSQTNSAAATRGFRVVLYLK